MNHEQEKRAEMETNKLHGQIETLTERLHTLQQFNLEKFPWTRINSWNTSVLTCCNIIGRIIDNIEHPNGSKS